MAVVQIRCTFCNKYLGEIRDAKLRKGMGHVCDTCIDSVKTQQASKSFDDIYKQSNPLEDIFGGIFGNKKF